MEPIVVVVGLGVLAVLIAIVVTVMVSRQQGESPNRPVTSRSPALDPRRHSLRKRLGRTRAELGGRLTELLGREQRDTTFWEDLEEALIAADVGFSTSATVVEDVRRSSPPDGEAARVRLEDGLVRMLDGHTRSLNLVSKPAVVLVVGVNGTGKTTSIAKIAHLLAGEEKRVMLAAADTFRAAADEQLRTWANRAGADITSGEDGADPASVVFDAYANAVDGGYDVLIADTAGRLHSKANLMSELEKVARVLRREAGTIDEVLLVLDGTTGQNALNQARSFTKAVGVTGLVMTKLDGTAKGGIAISVERELGIPVKFIGVGEAMEDLIPFEPREFVEALLEP